MQRSIRFRTKLFRICKLRYKHGLMAFLAQFRQQRLGRRGNQVKILQFVIKRSICVILKNVFGIFKFCRIWNFRRKIKVHNPILALIFKICLIVFELHIQQVARIVIKVVGIKLPVKIIIAHLKSALPQAVFQIQFQPVFADVACRRFPWAFNGQFVVVQTVFAAEIAVFVRNTIFSVRYAARFGRSTVRLAFPDLYAARFGRALLLRIFPQFLYRIHNCLCRRLVSKMPQGDFLCLSGFFFALFRVCQIMLQQLFQFLFAVKHRNAVAVKFLYFRHIV